LREEGLVVEQRVGQVRVAQPFNLPLRLGAHQLLQASIHRREIAARIVVEALAPFLPTFCHCEAQDTVAFGVTEARVQTVDYSRAALEEVCTLDWLAIQGLFPASAELNVLFEQSAILDEELLILLVEL